MYPGVWRHGDWIRITPRGGAVIYGRSDATINRHGIRMGTAELYRAVEALPEVLDSLVVDLEYLGRESYMPLFVVLRDGAVLDDALTRRLKDSDPHGAVGAPRAQRDLPGGRDSAHAVGQEDGAAGQEAAPGHAGRQVFKLDAMANADSVAWFTEFARSRNTALSGAAARSDLELGVVAAAVEDQRLGAVAARAALHLADEDDVVALLVAAAVEALEHRGRAVEQRRAAAPALIRDAGEAVDALLAKRSASACWSAARMLIA